VNSHPAPVAQHWPSPAEPFEEPPISATSPSADRATLSPNDPRPISPLPASGGPCWTQAEPERENTYTEPTPPSSSGAPTSAVLPLADSARVVSDSPSPPSWPSPSLATGCRSCPGRRWQT